MDIIERLDTLWFSNNVLLSNTQTHPKTTTCPNLEAPPIQFVTTTPQTQDVQVEEGHSEVVVQVGDKSNKEEGDEEELIKLKGMRKVKKGLDQKRKIVGGLNFGFDVNEVYAFWMMMDGAAASYGRSDEDQRIGRWPVVPGKMPPLSDDMAMKVHLKSWAYAVACAVN